MNPFPAVFYCSAGLAVIASLLAACVERGTYKAAATATLIAPLSIIYLVGMYRVDGVDFINYQAYLGSERELIPDVGYRLLMELASLLGLTLSEFFLIQGLFTVAAIYALASKLKSELVITVTLYVLHAAIVRDFSQSRIALAVAIYFLALAQKRRLPYCLLTAASVSVHLSVVPLAAVYHWATLVSRSHRGRVFLCATPALFLLFGMELLLPLMAAVDPRVALYMNWRANLYGNPIESYSALLLLALIAAICYQSLRSTEDENSRVFLIMTIYAAVVFFAFRDIAIFASRLSNVVAALYPFAVGRALSLLPPERRSLKGVALSLGLLGMILLALIGRSGSLEVLQETQPALFTH